MDEIVRCVKVFGENGAPVPCDITIEHYTQAKLFAEWAPFVGQPSVRNRFWPKLRIARLLLGKRAQKSTS